MKSPGSSPVRICPGGFWPDSVSESEVLHQPYLDISQGEPNDYLRETCAQHGSAGRLLARRRLQHSTHADRESVLTPTRTPLPRRCSADARVRRQDGSMG